MMGFGQIPGLPAIPGLPQPTSIADEALRETSIRAFEYTWPTMQQRLREEMKRERYVTFALAGAVVLAIVGAQKLLK